jgi:hypothetical protein
MPHLTYFFLKQHLFYDWSIALAREGNETEITKETGDWRCKSYKSHKNYQGIAYCNLSHHGQAVHAQKGGNAAPHPEQNLTEGRRRREGGDLHKQEDNGEAGNDEKRRRI